MEKDVSRWRNQCKNVGGVIRWEDIKELTKDYNDIKDKKETKYVTRQK